MKTADIDYRDGALTCRGFLAYDETKTGAPSRRTGRARGLRSRQACDGPGKDAGRTWAMSPSPPTCSATECR